MFSQKLDKKINLFFLTEKMASRIAVKARPLAERLALPEKYKGGRIEKFYNYWKNVCIDYKESTFEIINGARDRPGKAFIYGLLGSSFLYLNHQRPSEQDFLDNQIRIHHELTVIPDSMRNSVAEKFSQCVKRGQNDGTLRIFNTPIFSVVWQDNFDASVGTFASQCDYIKPTYLEIIQERVIDVGVNGRWIFSEQAMKEFDVNCEEWDEKGQPINPDNQLQPLI